MQNPIFFGWTRSFWAFMATAVLLLDQGEPFIRAVATLLATLFGADADAWTQWGMDVAPLVTLGFAAYQRAGAARPYTLDPRALK